jgi:hypothetical protein
MGNENYILKQALVEPIIMWQKTIPLSFLFEELTIWMVKCHTLFANSYQLS